MWRILTILTGIASFFAVFLYWEKRRMVEEDPYYLFGDSLYQGASDETMLTEPPIQEPDQPKILEEMATIKDVPIMAH